MPVSLIKIIKLAGFTHDIGKLRVDKKILFKPGRLSAEEFKEIKKHPETGAKILKKSFGCLAPIVLSHHERYDGKGYPQGLKGECIPIESRIIAIADAFDAMTYGRPYQPAMSLVSACQTLKENSGTQFDPTITNQLKLINWKHNVF